MSDRCASPIQRAAVCTGFCCILLSPDAAFAEFTSACQALPFRGSVKQVVVEQGQGKRTADQLSVRMSKYSTTVVSRDQSVSTETSAHTDDPRHRQLSMYPTTVREYDPAGRMLSQTFKPNGFAIETITTCEYDKAGRLSLVKVKSAKGDVEETLTYSYGSNWRSERRVRAASAVLTTVTVDDKGRPIEESRVDETNRAKLSQLRFRYLPSGMETCVSLPGEPADCRTAKYDDHGNLVEQQSRFGITRATYEYDAHGNWISKVYEEPGVPAFVQKRAIVYW